MDPAGCQAPLLLETLDRGVRTEPNTPYDEQRQVYGGQGTLTCPSEQARMNLFKKALMERGGSVGYDGTKCSPAFCTAVFNGCTAVQLQLPRSGVTSSERQPASIRRINNKIKVNVVLPLIFAPSQASWRVKATFLSPSKVATIDVGLLSKKNSMLTTVAQLTFDPQEIFIEAKFEPKNDEGDPTEIKFVECVKEILHNPTLNPRGGSLQLSVVESHVRAAFEDTDVIIERYGSFRAAVSKHPIPFLLFEISDKEIESRGLDESAKGERIALTLHEKRGCKTLETQRTSFSRESEAILINTMKTLLSERDRDQRELMDILLQSPRFVFLLSPSFSSLMRFLSRHKKTFAWTTHPDKPTSIGLLGCFNRPNIPKTPPQEPQPKAATSTPTESSKRKRQKKKSQSPFKDSPSLPTLDQESSPILPQRGQLKPTGEGISIPYQHNNISVPSSAETAPLQIPSMSVHYSVPLHGQPVQQPNGMQFVASPQVCTMSAVAPQQQFQIQRVQQPNQNQLQQLQQQQQLHQLQQQGLLGLVYSQMQATPMACSPIAPQLKYQPKNDSVTPAVAVGAGSDIFHQPTPMPPPISLGYGSYQLA